MFFRGRCARHDIFRLDDLLNAIVDLRYLDAIQIHETMFPPCCGALQRLTAETKHEKMSWFIFFSYARTTERMLPDPIGNVLEILEINCGLGEKKRAKWEPLRFGYDLVHHGWMIPPHEHQMRKSKFNIPAQWRPASLCEPGRIGKSAKRFAANVGDGAMSSKGWRHGKFWLLASIFILTAWPCELQFYCGSNMVFVYGDAVPNSAQIQSAMATYRDITYFYFRVLGIYWNISTKKQ